LRTSGLREEAATLDSPGRWFARLRNASIGNYRDLPHTLTIPDPLTHTLADY